MISYPWDSVKKGLSSNGYPLYDRHIKASDLQAYYSRVFSNGVFVDDEHALAVTPAEGMNVLVDSGWCVINGTFGHEPDVRELAVQAADSTYDRIDTVVLRWNANIDMRNIDPYIKTGEPADVPVRPDLTREASVYEIGIADIFVAKESGAISSARITDTRLETERCGAVFPFMDADTNLFFEQLKAAVEEYEAKSKIAADNLKKQTDIAVNLAREALDETLAGSIINSIQELSDSVVHYTDVNTVTANMLDDSVWGKVSELILTVKAGETGIAEAISMIAGIEKCYSFYEIFSNEDNANAVLSSEDAMSFMESLDEKYLVLAICAAAGVTDRFQTLEELFDDEPAVNLILDSAMARKVIRAFPVAKEAFDSSEVVNEIIFSSTAGAIQALDDNWDTDSIWGTLSNSASLIIAYPERFEKYIGKTINYTHASYGAQQLRVVDIAHYDKADGSGKAGFVFDHVGIPFRNQMNSAYSNAGGLPAMPLSNTINSSFLNGMPQEIRDQIVEVNIPCKFAVPTDSPLKLFFLSEMEVFGTQTYDQSGTWLKWYENNNNGNSRLKKAADNTSYPWWLRSPYPTSSDSFCLGNSSISASKVVNIHGVSPSFCIG